MSITSKEEIAAIADGFRDLYTAQYDHADAAGRLYRAISRVGSFLYLDDMDSEARVTCDDGTEVHLYEIPDKLRELDSSGSSGDTDIHDLLLDKVKVLNPDFAGISEAVDTAEYFFTGIHYPDSSAVNNRYVWQTQMNAPDVTLRVAREHYHRNRDAYFERALGLAAAEGVVINLQ